MSRSTEQKLSQIPCGTHLVAPITAEVIRGHDNLPVVTKEGAKGVTIRFGETTGEGHLTDHDFWVPSSQYAKFCIAMSVDTSKPFREQVIGKALWICVREIKLMSGDKQVGSRNEIFDFIECVDVLQKPIVSGDPCQRANNTPLGVFVDYEQVEGTKTSWVGSDALSVNDFVDVHTQETRSFSNKLAAEGYTEDVVFGVNQKTGKAVNGDEKLELAVALITGNPLPADESLIKQMVPLQDSIDSIENNMKAKLALGKKIIAEGEKKDMSSLNQKNTVHIKETDGKITNGKMEWTDDAKTKVEFIPDPFEEELNNITPEKTKEKPSADSDWDDL
ncbi:MAG: hypothetical protein V4721_10530 [Bacteroidota bacterium]